MGVHISRAASGSLVVNLLLDPVVGLQHTNAKRNRRSPSQAILDHSIVTVATANSLRSRDVLDGEILTSKVHGELSKLIHVNHLICTKVEGFRAIREHDLDRSHHTILDKHKGAGLESVSPHLEFSFGHDRLSAESGGHLFTTTLPCSSGSVHIVVTGNASVDGEIFGVCKGHFLSIQLLESVGILGLSWPGHVLAKAGIGRVCL
mmetsp:Transcript_115323/g.247890  ORF Transcript_115323/g.247890 Transcript_115323/m.247890 type:complete len:205 (+) Transcript_115323:280-894(+)